MLLVYFKKAFPSLTFILKVTRVFPYFYKDKVDHRLVSTLLIIKINPACKRSHISSCQEKNRNLACITNKQVINC